MSPAPDVLEAPAARKSPAFTPPPLTGPGRLRRPTGWKAVRRWFSGSPGRMRTIGVILALACLLFTAVGGWMAQTWTQAVDDAKTSGSHVGLDQRAYDKLIQAHAMASSIYLAGDDVTKAENQKYQETMSEAAVLLAEASGQPGRVNQAERTELIGKIGGGFLRYTDLVGLANARRSTALGYSFLNLAGSVLNNEIRPALLKISESTRAEIDDSYDQVNKATRWFFIVFGVTALVFLIMMFWLARRSHRLLNVPVVGAAVIMTIVAIAAGLVFSTQTNKLNQAADETYVNADSFSLARAVIYEAKSQESWGIIDLNSYETREKYHRMMVGIGMCLLGGKTFPDLANKYQATYTGCQVSLRDRAAAEENMAALARWEQAHLKVQEHAAAGDWKKARSIIIDEKAAPAAAFQALERSTAAGMQASHDKLVNQLSEPNNALLALFWSVVIAGLIAMVASVWGVIKRLSEYR